MSKLELFVTAYLAVMAAFVTIAGISTLEGNTSSRMCITTYEKGD